MAILPFPEPYPSVATLGGHDGPVEIIAVDPVSGECMARIPEVDPTTGGVDGEVWVGTLDPDDLARLTAMVHVAEPPEPFDETMALGGAHDIKRQLLAGK